jgi:hypothetical protein
MQKKEELPKEYEDETYILLLAARAALKTATTKTKKPIKTDTAFGIGYYAAR